MEFKSTAASSGGAAYGIPSGKHLPAATRLGRVVLQIGDLSRSLSYYEKVLGLRVLRRAAGRAALGANDDDAVLVELHERSGAAPAPYQGRLGLYHFAILVPDRVTLESFTSHLSALGLRAGSADHLVSEALYLRDPDGLGIEVYADRPRSVWRTREVSQGRELVIGTEPLDLDDLIRAAGGRGWTGMPPGTTLGHMHLHVGDLEAAAGFYHRALGLDAMVWSYPGALFLSAGGYHHHLGVNTWAGLHAQPPDAGDARLLEWTLVVPGVEAAEAAIRNLHAAGYGTRTEGPSGTAEDPWGTALRIGPDEGPG